MCTQGWLLEWSTTCCDIVCFFPNKNKNRCTPTVGDGILLIGLGEHIFLKSCLKLVLCDTPELIHWAGSSITPHVKSPTKMYQVGAARIHTPTAACGNCNYLLYTVQLERLSNASMYDGVYHTITPPCGGFPSSIARQPRGCQYRTTRFRKALGESFPTPTCLAPALFQLWIYRAWKVGPGVCDIYRCINMQ